MNSSYDFNKIYDLNKDQMQYKTISNKCYVELTFDDTWDIIEYQKQMISNNSIDNLVNFKYTSENGNAKFYYNVTSVVNLEYCINRKKISKTELINFLQGFINVYNSLEKYQLDFNSICMNSNFIFIDVSNFTPYFIYLPIINNNFEFKSFKDFIMDKIIIKNNVEIMDDNLIQLLIIVLTDKKFQMKNLENFINEISTKNENNTICQNQYVSNSIKKENSKEKSGNMLVNLIKLNFKKDKVKNSKNKVILKKEAHVFKSKTKESIIFIITSIGLVCFFIFIFKSTSLIMENGKLNLQHLGLFIIIVFAIDFIIYRELFINKKNIKNSKNNKKQNKKEVIEIPTNEELLQ